MVNSEYFEHTVEKKVYPKNRKDSGLTRSEYQKKYRKENKEYLREYSKVYQRNHYKKYPEKYLYWSIKGRASKQGLPFDLTLEDLGEVPSHCPILGIPIKRNTGGLSRAQDSPSVDRIIPELGYVKGNIQIISMRANVMKNDASPEQLRRFADWVLRTFPP